MVQFNFNANDVEPKRGFEALPAGTYQAIVTGSQMKQTKSGTGKYLELTFQVTDAEFAGRLIWDRLNLVNQSAQAVEIAKEALGGICRAVGEMVLNDTYQLHNKPLSIRVIQKDGQNEIKDYLKVEKPGQPPQAAGVPW